MNKRTMSIFMILISYSQISKSSDVTDIFTVIDTRTNQQLLFRTSFLPENDWSFMVEEVLQTIQAKNRNQKTSPRPNTPRPNKPRPETPRPEFVSLDDITFAQPTGPQTGSQRLSILKTICNAATENITSEKL